MRGGSVIHVYAWKTLWQQAQDPRIGEKVHAYAWKAHSRPRYNVSLTRSTLITTPRTSLVTHSLAPTHVNPMLPRHSYPVLPCSWLPALLIHLASTKSHSRYNLSVTRSPHPCPLSITSSLMLQHETHVTPTPQRHNNVTSCSLSSSLYTTPPTHHPRICV
ncbi:hypothetical protein PIB30_105105 [Stylosanthes scabra]|uniref:Uncharacterized protein n=1 Tax=Stylosanthes scabra TaxID=79078 RepID=A0ABU6RZ81_9FABA|nr:hypothetical protein [Stylosanthes scabra]